MSHKLPRRLCFFDHTASSKTHRENISFSPQIVWSLLIIAGPPLRRNLRNRQSPLSGHWNSEAPKVWSSTTPKVVGLAMPCHPRAVPCRSRHFCSCILGKWSHTAATMPSTNPYDAADKSWQRSYRTVLNQGNLAPSLRSPSLCPYADPLLRLVFCRSGTGPSKCRPEPCTRHS